MGIFRVVYDSKNKNHADILDEVSNLVRRCMTNGEGVTLLDFLDALKVPKSKIDIVTAKFSYGLLDTIISPKQIFFLRQSVGTMNVEIDDLEGIRGIVMISMLDEYAFPSVVNVEIFTDGCPTVKVTFDDGTSTTAVCSERDHFDFEVGIGICIGKRALGSEFNTLVRKAKKVYERGEEAKVSAAYEEGRRKIILARREAKRQERIKRREEKRRQETIDILAEAIRLANETTHEMKKGGEN